MPSLMASATSEGDPDAETVASFHTGDSELEGWVSSPTAAEAEALAKELAEFSLPAHMPLRKLISVWNEEKP